MSIESAIKEVARIDAAQSVNPAQNPRVLVARWVSIPGLENAYVIHSGRNSVVRLFFWVMEKLNVFTADQARVQAWRQRNIQVLSSDIAAVSTIEAATRGVLAAAGRDPIAAAVARGSQHAVAERDAAFAERDAAFDERDAAQVDLSQAQAQSQADLAVAQQRADEAVAANSTVQAQARAAIRAAEQEAERAEAQREHVAQQFDGLNEQVAQLEVALEAARAAQPGQAAGVITEEEHQQLQGQMQALRAALQAAQGQIEQVRQLEARVEELARELEGKADLEQQVGQLTAEVQRREGEAADAREALEALQEDLDALQGRFNQLEADHAELEGDYNALEQASRQLQREKGQAEDRANLLQEDYDQVLEERQRVTGILNQLRNANQGAAAGNGE